MKNNNLKEKTWTELKSISIKFNSKLDYTKHDNRYKVFTYIGDSVFFTNLYNPSSTKPIGINQTNDVDYTDFVDNFLTSIDDKPPSSIEQLPISDLDGIKLAVHSSSKPFVDGKTTYAVWTGSGDDPITGMICQGELMEFNLIPGLPTRSIDVKFNQSMNGRIWVHEGYLKFQNGGAGDYMDAEVVSESTPLQTSINLDLIIDVDGWISYISPGGGTHGFADASKIVLIPRSFSSDGQWDYDGTNLTPNLSNTGQYKISINEQIIHKYMNKIPCRGSSYTYFSMTSDETTEILNNYFLRVVAHNVSDTSWFASVIMEIYRERTFNP